MKKIIAIFILVYLCFGQNLNAQDVRFTFSGTIEYQKTINMYAILKRNLPSGSSDIFYKAFEQYKQDHPQFKILKSVLNFSQNKTLFVPEPESQINSSGFFATPEIALQNNTVFVDFNLKTYVTQKGVLNDVFLLKDTLKKIKWKLTDEVRTIEGYECRRANAVILDSIYVVAFYTDRIPVSGGPESFTGLPGMILQLALPHENVTWIATKITDSTIPSNGVIPPQKGVPINFQQFKDRLDALFRSKAINIDALKALLL